MIYLASDHAGFERKKMVREYLEGQDMDVVDLGAEEFVQDDDYPDYAFALAQEVAKNRAEGILICGSGQGVCMVANKVPGIRAALGYNKFAARSSREDDDANVLCLPARDLTDDEVTQVISTWLNTDFSEEERHERRIAKIREIEADLNK